MAPHCPAPGKIGYMHVVGRWLLLGLIAWFGSFPSARADAALPYPQAVADRFPPPGPVYDTPGLRPGREDFTRNDELNAALRVIAARGAAELLELGVTGTGAPLLGLRFRRGPGHPALLLLGQQHGNEPAGAEALLVVARELADPTHPLTAVLERLDVLLVPRVNPDGAALAQRRNAAGRDINRDHLLLQTPEARALAGLAIQTRPVAVVDLHEFAALPHRMGHFGSLRRQDLLWQYATTPNLPQALTDASEAVLGLPMRGALAREGLSVDWYSTSPDARAGLRLSMGGLGPNLARNASGLRHAASLLLESRGLDLGRLHIQRRVHSQVLAVHSLLRSAADQAPALQRLQADVTAAVVAQACRGDIVVEAGYTYETREVVMLDPVTGADKPVRVDWGSATPWRATRTRARPCGYWLAAHETQAVERLRALGLTVQSLPQAQELQVERYRALASADGPAAGGSAADPKTGPVHRVTVALAPDTLAAPAGSWYLPLDQSLANLAVAALEPDTPDSYFAHRLVGELESLARVMAPLP
ncbi:MAG: M14 family metallocarboxypeptidase [Rubrivivax sp.]|nr:M14 family metallocarboxypeptidase [Rubrivivax sp.]